jgi:colicin import membrane protein
MLARDIPFSQQFFSVVRPVISEEKEKLIALASLSELKKFIPALDTERNIDLQPIAFDSCVVNLGNKNGDIIDTDSALATYKTFLYKFIDTEHNRKNVIGVILSATISEFGTNRILTEDEVRGTNIPFYITLGGVLWRAVNGELCDLVEDSNDIESKNYQKVSASWEVGFSGYDIVEFENLTDKELSKGTIITDPETKKSLEKYLKANGGSGAKGGKGLYRLLNESVIAMGVGLTEKPAADVKGIAVNTDTKTVLAAESSAHTDDSVEKNNNAQAEIISQLDQKNVKTERQALMKITSIADITDETLKQCSASVVTDFIKSELQKANDSFVADKSAQATAAQKLEQTAQSLAAQISEMKVSLEALAKEKAEREKVDAFNSRMSEVFASYEFPDDVSKIVVEEIKGMSSNEAFASWKSKADTIFKSYSKTAIAAAKKAKADDEEAEAKAKQEAEAKAAADKKAKEEQDEKDAKDGKKKDAKASEAIASAVEDAIENGKKDAGLPNSSGAVAQGLKERFKTAFAEENFVIKQ